MTFFFGFFWHVFVSGRRHMTCSLSCAWTQQDVSFHPLWSLFDVPVARMRASAMHAFLCHETNFFCVSTTSGLLHDVFQYVSVHPIPIEICYGLLSYTKTPNCLCVVLILYLVWMCAAGASSCPPYKCLRTFLHKSLLYLPQVCTNFLAGHLRMIRATTLDRDRR